MAQKKFLLHVKRDGQIVDEARIEASVEIFIIMK